MVIFGGHKGSVDTIGKYNFDNLESFVINAFENWHTKKSISKCMGIHTYYNFVFYQSFLDIPFTGVAKMRTLTNFRMLNKTIKLLICVTQY